MNSKVCSLVRKSKSPSSKIHSTISASASYASNVASTKSSFNSSVHQDGFSFLIVFTKSNPNSACIFSSFDVASTALLVPFKTFLYLLKDIITKNCENNDTFSMNIENKTTDSK